MNTPFVLVLTPTFSQTIEQRICTGIHERLLGENIKLVFVPLDYLPEDADALTDLFWIHDLLKSLQPDLLLVYGGGLSYISGHEALQKVLARYTDIPVINMGSPLAGYPTIEVDNYGAMLTLMRDILRRRSGSSLLFLSGPALNEDSLHRQRALEAALAEQGQTLTSDQILQGDFTAATAERLVSRYLAKVDQPPGLIVCANDLSAKGVLDALAASPWSCPEDVWVTGYDDFEYAAFVMPGLTTVHYPAERLGACVAEAGLRQLAGDVIGSVRTVQGFPVYRGSTGDVHPGIGQHQERLLAQWELLQQRDNNSRKIKILRNVNRKQSLKDLLISLEPALGNLGVSHLSVFLNELSDDGTSGYTEYTSQGAQRHLSPGQKILPVKPVSAENYWVLCPLHAEQVDYGFAVACCAPQSAEFIDFLAPQLAELLHTDALEAKNEHYRLQNELNERMASLGSLVSGVAHEANTPIGNGKLAASSMLDLISQVKNDVDNSRLTKARFEQFINETEEYAEIIFQSLDRAAKIISNFKMVSVDQTAEEKRRFDLGEYVDSVLLSLRHQLKGTSVKLEAVLTEGVIVDTFPGAVAQVITNLFMNSLKHGFDHGSLEGTLRIELMKTNQCFRLIIADDGVGASESVLNHIFDPFFTTTRGKGGSGLGMHIVFNLLSQKLNWSIDVQSAPGEGMKIILEPNRSER
ncbi:substrate-binding domain-containing protein [Reinekea blandensis]|uniref:histidine kinase n=1 Tax=Reinekea blandensis MED297 TaxID=314283 RepID=A4BBI2_9GAMM|nr:substrate-binding domain-containing protein [Reinekea blandensis]EAR10317.1 two-component sensor histidine kinase protein [Reinekea sp. MED297] [Reinekea blandensis MED297]